MTPPAPSFEFVRNFRDCGGYRTADGRTVRSGLLFRSGQFPHATPSDLDALKALGLGVIVDLRRPEEREKNPCRRWHGFDARLIEEAEGAGPRDLGGHFGNAGANLDAARAAMLRAYREFPFEQRLIDLYRTAFVALAEDSGAMLVHCAAGKDRTGLFVALTHRLLGVSAEDTMANYLATNRQVVRDKTLIDSVRQMFDANGETVSDDAVTLLLSVSADYLDASFASIIERHGSVDAYLRDVLDVSDAQRDAIRARMLA
jgi:protein tyrosine/serine phosphatase